MRAIQYLVGDATNPKAQGYRLIVHICNDLGSWGQGFVLALSRKWDAPEAAYLLRGNRRYPGFHCPQVSFLGAF